jgi:hypothetical protein
MGTDIASGKESGPKQDAGHEGTPPEAGGTIPLLGRRQLIGMKQVAQIGFSFLSSGSEFRGLMPLHRRGTRSSARSRPAAYGGSSDMMMVPEAANMPPTPWHTENLAPGIWARRCRASGARSPARPTCRKCRNACRKDGPRHLRDAARHPLDVQLEDLDRLAKEVIPAFRDTRTAAAAQ